MLLKQNHTGFQSKSSERSSKSLGNKNDRKSPVASPKPHGQHKESQGGDDDEPKAQEASAPKVPPLKIVIPGGAGAGSRNEQEGEGM